MKGGDEGHLLRLSMPSQFQDAVRGIPQQGDRQGGKPAAHQLHHLTRPYADGLVTLAPSVTLPAGVVASTHKKGKAQRCLVQGKVTTTAMTIHRSPGLLTDRLRLERALSR